MNKSNSIQQCLAAVVAVGLLAASLLWVAGAKAQQGVKGVPEAQKIFVGTADPGWAPIGSIWIVGTNNGPIKVQTGEYNEGGSLTMSNFTSICTSNCAGGTNAVYTNIFLGTTYTQVYPTGSWVTVKP